MYYEASNYREHIYTAREADIIESMTKLIQKRRKQSYFQGYAGYLFVATVKWDPAKIWQEGTQKAIDMCTELGIIPNFSDPQNKNTNGTAECLVRQEELLMKARLAQNVMDIR